MGCAHSKAEVLAQADGEICKPVLKGVEAAGRVKAEKAVVEVIEPVTSVKVVDSLPHVPGEYKRIAESHDAEDARSSLGLPFSGADEDMVLRDSVSSDAGRKTAPHPSEDKQLSLMPSPVWGRPEPQNLQGEPYRGYQLGPPRPPCDEERVAMVNAIKANMTEADPEIEHIVNLICTVFKTKSALVALLDSDRVYITNSQGFSKGDFPWRWSFCAWTLPKTHHECIVIEDAAEDARFKDNNFVVNEPHVRFYCGTPLVASNGHRLGTLCFADQKPRKFEAENCMILANMAELVVRELEKDKAMAEQRAKAAQLQQVSCGLLRAMDCFKDAVMFVDCSQPGWRILHNNAAWSKATGIEREDIGTRGFWELFEYPTKHKSGSGQSLFVGEKSTIMNSYNAKARELEHPWEAFAKECKKAKEFVVRSIKCKAMPNKLFNLYFRPATNDGLDDNAIPVGVPCSVPSAKPGSLRHQYFFASLREVNSDAKMQLLGSASLKPRHNAFDDVELGPLLGRGSYGRVYRGTWNGQLVAVKVVEAYIQNRKDTTGNPLEAILTMDLSHPNIVRTYKYSTILPSQLPGSPTGSETSMSGGTPAANPNNVSTGSHGSASSNSQGSKGSRMGEETWLLMEYCDKGSMMEAIDKGMFRLKPSIMDGKVNMGAVLTTASEVAGACAYLHSQGIVHGDLAGGNILLSASSGDKRGFRAKVADFGMARELDIKSCITTRSYGTVTHMPPELLSTGHLSKACDVYAFGVLLWEMYNGGRAWAGLNHTQVMNAVCIEMKRPTFPEDAPKAFADLAYRCLAADPADRPTFPDIIQELFAQRRALAEAEGTTNT